MHRSEPDTKLLSRLISLQAELDGPTDDEIISVVILLLNAGHEATVHQLGNAITTLIRQPPDNQYWWQDKKLADNIVAECMRYDAPLHLFTRYAQEDVSLSEDVTIEAGTEKSRGQGSFTKYKAASEESCHIPRQFKQIELELNIVKLP